jgi:hypothetical protein
MRSKRASYSASFAQNVASSRTSPAACRRSSIRYASTSASLALIFSSVVHVSKLRNYNVTAATLVRRDSRGLQTTPQIDLKTSVRAKRAGVVRCQNFWSSGLRLGEW